MGKLTDILSDDSDDSFRKLWKETEAAGELTPLPNGEYIARIIAGELTKSRTNGTPGYKLTFQVFEGEYKGRLLWLDLWLTEPAIPMTKRDLCKLGVTDVEQLEQPLPPGIRCQVKLALRKDDDGTEYNKVRHFDVIGVDEPEVDPFAPADPNGEGGGNG